MNINELKLTYNAAIQPDPLQAIVKCTEAWTHFKSFLQLFPEGDENEEFGFSFSFANINDGITSRIDPNLFQVYFGRLIDAKKNLNWSFAEIDFYYRFEMNETLERLMRALPRGDIETFYNLTEEPSIIQKKQSEVMGFADQQSLIWNEIQKLKPMLASYHFWVW